MSSNNVLELQQHKYLDPDKGPRAFNSALSKLGGKPSGWRLAVFCHLKAYRNPENRVWVGLVRMAEELGCSKTTVAKCMRELEAIGVIVEVAFDQRSDFQEGLPGALKVWQLTGKAVIDDVEYWYWPSANLPLTGKSIYQSVNLPMSDPKELYIEDSSKEVKKEESSISPLPPGAAEKKPAASQAKAEGEKKAKKPTPQQYRGQLEEKEQKRWDVLFNALAIGLHEIDMQSLPSAARARYAPLIHKQVRVAIDFEWLTADHIESFLKWYKKENGTASLPTSESGFTKWIVQYASQHGNGAKVANTPDPNCPTCMGAGQVILKRGSITEPAVYGKCPVCMVKEQVA